MKLLMLIGSICMVRCGVEEAIEHHEKATSYQNIHMEHFHPIPTYIKKEDKHLLEHPVSLGTSSSKVEIHHGGKHDHGYALASAENNVHGFDFDQGHLAGHDYQVHDQGEGYSQHLGQQEAAKLQFHHLTSSGLAGYAGLSEQGHVYAGHES